MDKRSLSAIPRPELTDKDREMPLLVENMSYLVTADRLEVNENETLIINFFEYKKSELKSAFRTFCQMEDYITQDLTTDGIKWKTGAINYLTGYLYWHRNSGNIVIASVRDRKKILDFLSDFRKRNGIDEQQNPIPRGSAVDSEVENRIDEYQDTIKEWKLQKKHEKEKAEIDLHMDKFGDIPEDYGRFVENVVFDDKNYIFYSKAKARAYCTKCGHDFEIRKDGLYHKIIAIWNNGDQIRHNHTVLCPYCNKYFTCKSEGMGRKNLFAVQWSVLVQKHNDEVLTRYFCHTKDFQDDFSNPKIESKESYRTVHTAEKVMDFEWGIFKNTQEIRWCKYKEKIYGYFIPPETAVPRSAVLYNDNLLEDVAGTCMKYSAVDIYVDKVVQDRRLLKPWCIDWYFNAYRKKPYLEQLLKVGFYRLTEAVLEGEHGCPQFKSGRTVLETLRVTKQQYKMLREIANPSARDVSILHYAGEIQQKEFNILRYKHDNGYDSMYKKYLDMRRYTTIYKLDKYINRQKIKNEIDYFDYIRWLEEMGYDMRNEFNLFPKNFIKAHDEKSKEYVRFKDELEKENIKRFNKLLKKLREDNADMDAMNLKLDGMFIRLPKELDELKKEGEILHHCVGTYVNRVAKGETMIFFIRQEADPDQPFFTLEWKGRVVQCRGYRNCDMTPEVKAFVNLFQEKMVEYENEPKKRRKVG